VEARRKPCDAKERNKKAEEPNTVKGERG